MLHLPGDRDLSIFKHPIRAIVVINRVSPSVAAAGAAEEKENNSEPCMLCALRCASVFRVCLSVMARLVCV